MTAACETIPAVVPRQQINWLTASLAIFVLASICFIYHLGASPLAGTEGHRAITAEQMLQNGNYLLPRLYGHLYLMKPPLTYWLIAGSERLLGPGELVWRLPGAISSALLAAGICAMTAVWFDSFAGFVAGLAFIGLIPLWSQDRSADVDAINHLGAIMAALAIIDIGLCRRRVPVGSIVLAIVGVGIAMMSKGPAGLPIILGAVLGPSVLNRDARIFRRPWIYLALIVGIIPLVVWAFLAHRALGPTFFSPEVSGAAEARSRMFINNLSHLPLVLTLPFVVLAYGVPTSLLMALPFAKQFKSAFEPDRQRLFRSLLGCVLAAFVIQMLAGMINPRYAFLDLPLLCPIAGAAASGWRKNYWPLVPRNLGLNVLTCLSIAYCGVGAVLIVLSHHMGFHTKPWPIPLLLGALVIMALAARSAKRTAWCSVIAAAAICASALTYGLYKSADESVRSAKSQSPALASAVDTSAPIFTWNVLWSQPEFFYYAHLHPIMEHPLPRNHFPDASWLVMDDTEWDVWQSNPKYASHLSQVHKLHPYKHIAYVCRYSR